MYYYRGMIYLDYIMMASMDEGIMKELTGGDPIQCRALFKDSITFTPQFKLVVCTNTLFDIASNDEGTWRRIRAIPYNSKFDDNPDKNDPLQFKKDSHIDEIITPITAV